MRVIIELSLRDEFEIVRANEGYKKLIDILPYMFVGNPTKLEKVIKVICKGTKKCFKENKMYIGPWRKNKYMQAKLLNPYYERA